MNSKAALAAVLVLSCLAIASCGGGGDDTSNATEPASTAPSSESEAGGQTGEPEAASGKLERSAKVEIVNFAYGPDPVQVQTGGKVIWQNMDSVPHTATADDGSFDTGTIDEGKLKSETFKEAGTFAYHCEIHPEMHGTVEVVDAE